MNQERRLKGWTYPGYGSDLDYGSLRLDQQRDEGLTHEDNGEKVRLEGSSRLGDVDIEGGYCVI